MSRRRDEEDQYRWAMQAREKKARVDAWLVGRTDGGVPVKPSLDRCMIKSVDYVNDPFGGNDVGGVIEMPSKELAIHFKATFARETNGYGKNYSSVESIDVRMHLAFDPRDRWNEWTRATLTESERIRLETLIVATFAERRREHETPPRQTEPTSPTRKPPWSYGPTDRPGSPHLDPNDSEYWSREAVQERANDKGLLREGRDRYGDDWYPGKYTN